MTSAKSSRSMATAMEQLGVDVTYERVDNDGHAMLRRANYWHERSAGYLVQHLLVEPNVRLGQDEHQSR